MFKSFPLVRPDGRQVEALWHSKFSNFAQSRMRSTTGYVVFTAEALYQAAKFPNNPELQKAILAKQDPKEAKELARQHENELSERWRRYWRVYLRIEVMRWVLRRKFAQNPKLAKLLLDSAPKPIVEPSRFDDFWGLVIDSPSQWKGKNMLGKLLMEARTELIENGHLTVPAPPVQVL